MAPDNPKSTPGQPAPKPPAGGAKQQTAKQLAAAGRAEAAAAERRRERLIRVIGGLVVALVVVGLLAIGFLSGGKQEAGSEPPKPDPNAALPTGVQSDTYGVPYGSGWTASNAAQLPTLELWEDFQCPACKALDEAAGADIRKVANDGLVKLLWRSTTFLERKFPESNNSSSRATSAWGCAIDAGETGDYHDGVFAMQPETEGVGYTDDQLKTLGSQVGITGEALTTFESCVDEGKYLAWSANGYQKFIEAGITGTPTALLNGAQVPNSQLADPAQLRELIEAATAK